MWATDSELADNALFSGATAACNGLPEVDEPPTEDAAGARRRAREIPNTTRGLVPKIDPRNVSRHWQQAPGKDGRSGPMQDGRQVAIERHQGLGRLQGRWGSFGILDDGLGWRIDNGRSAAILSSSRPYHTYQRLEIFLSFFSSSRPAAASLAETP